MAKTDKPNILVIWGDDIGISNLSCYSHGLMGYETQNIDRLAKEGMMFTDPYGEQSCTAGRSSFITGQSVYRTGLSKVGIPGAPVGMSDKIITIAAALKNQGYSTGQFGKNHLGDLNSMLPTAHGFDEFFGNLYHLNAQEDPENPDYPSKKDFPKFFETFGPRGVIHPAQPTRTTAPSNRAGARSENRRSRIRGRSTRSEWRPATTNSSPPRRISSSGSTKTASRSLRGSISLTCTCTLIPSHRVSVRLVAGSRRITTP